MSGEIPPIWAIVSGNGGVQAVFGNPPRVTPFGDAGSTPVTPYAVWQVIAGQPDNLLDGPPQMDYWLVQFDVYATTLASALSGAGALRAALEVEGTIERYGETIREAEAPRLFRYSFDFKIWAVR